MRRRTTARAAVREVLHDLGDAVERQWPAVRADIDPEAVHQLRITLRQARAVLWAARDVLPDPAREDALDLAGALADRTGAARDLDVQLADWAARLDGTDPVRRAALEPVLDRLRRRRASVHDELAAALDDLGLDAWITRWHALVDASRDEHGRRPRHAKRRVGPVIARRLEQAHRRLVHDGRAIDDDSPAEQLHDLRKDAKRLRYVAESFAPLVERGRRRDYVRRVKALLDHLGAHQDAVVHQHQLAELVHEFATAPAPTCDALAELTTEADARSTCLRSGFAEAFDRFDRGATRRSLRRVLDDLRD
jgi:CHAD domain-containing protein